LRVEAEVVSGQMEFVCGIEEDPEVSLKEVLEKVGFRRGGTGGGVSWWVGGPLREGA
jgi:hypothetical protein